jgi:hypothetical protein
VPVACSLPVVLVCCRTDAPAPSQVQAVVSEGAATSTQPLEQQQEAAPQSSAGVTQPSTQQGYQQQEQDKQQCGSCGAGQQQPHQVHSLPVSASQQPHSSIEGANNTGCTTGGDVSSSGAHSGQQSSGQEVPGQVEGGYQRSGGPFPVRRGLFAAEAVKLLQDFYSAGNPLGELWGQWQVVLNRPELVWPCICPSISGEICMQALKAPA